MERELETIFDTVTGLQASILDTHQLKDMCREQQSITMNRVASWLRMNSKIFQLEWDTTVSRELKNLADELDYLAEVATSEIFSTQSNC
tara:strand:+ start:278 stop:544 length:267 start_codon:yes stop_codon:yes gene_type:complete